MGGSIQCSTSRPNLAQNPDLKLFQPAFSAIFCDPENFIKFLEKLQKLKKLLINFLKTLVFDQSRGCTQNWTPHFSAWSLTECCFWLFPASEDSHLEERILQNNHSFFRHNILQRTKPTHNLSNKKFWMCTPAASAREKAATRSLQKREGRPRKPTGFRGFRGRPSARARARARAR